MTDAALVKELQLLDQIDEISKAYEKEYGLPPTNVSNWDANNAHRLEFLSTIPPVVGDGTNYIFSYTLAGKSNILSALNYRDERWRSLVSHSGSAIIVTVCNWLRAKGAKKLLILGPRYFTVPHCLEAMGIKFETRHWKRTAGGYELPSEIELCGYDGLWITNPVYCTGVYLSSQKLQFLQDLCAEGGKFFVLDECLSSTRLYVGPHLRPDIRTTIVTAPHKSVCVNAFKFAIAIFHESQLQHFEHWSDVWLGCLPQSSLQAIEHFRSGVFRTYEARFDALVAESSFEFLNLTKLEIAAEVDDLAFGYFRTVYFPHLPSDLGIDLEFIRAAVFATGAIFIPGIRNELDPAVGFSFRVNLAAFDAETRGAYVRLIRWIATRR